MTSYAFVLDADNKQLAPTKEQKAWFLIRKKRATLVSRYPMVIQLKKKIQGKDSYWSAVFIRFPALLDDAL